MDRFSKYCKIISGYAFKAKDLMEESDIPVIKIGNISNGGNVNFSSNTQYVDKSFLSLDEKYHIKNRDILISLTGSHMNQPNSMVGRSCRSYDNDIYLLNQRAGKVIPFDNANKDYLYYLLSSEEMKYSIVIRAYGAANQVNISPSDIEGIKWDFPEYDVQCKIGKILANYDDLIEKNNRKIQILQDMAEELYKEWFVRFRFPGHETATKKESALGNIPNSFNVIKMADIFDNYIGGGWGNDDENKQYSIPAYVIRGTDFPSITKGDISTCPYRWHKESNYKSRQLKPNDIVIEISGGTAEQPVGRAILVDDNLIKRFDNKVICASFCKQVSLKQDKISPIYFYYWMKFLYDTRMIDRFQLQSTGIINFKFEYFVRKGDVLLPPKSLMDKFDNIVTTMRKDISHLAEQNNILKQQRNLLLPRLMSGKLEVKVKQEV